MTNEPWQTNRRGFLHSAVRLGVFGALGWLFTHLAGRALRNPEACSGQGLCGRCGLARNCALPRAILHRADQKERLRG
ncbi:MAG: hypothetical protein L6R28_15660 [Planctomycetes bacterium]|nr:hypothetical protein [Planctomycetota bacterium]